MAPKERPFKDPVFQGTGPDLVGSPKGNLSGGPAPGPLKERDQSYEPDPEANRAGSLNTEPGPLCRTDALNQVPWPALEAYPLSH